MAYSGDYTIVLSGGTAYKNQAGGDTVELTGLSYAGGIWTLDNFEFTTSATTAMETVGDTVITIVGTNSITGGGHQDPTFGLIAENDISINGIGTLTITAGDSSNNNSFAILVKGKTKVSADITANGGMAETSSAGLRVATDASVTVTGDNGRILAQGGKCQNTVGVSSMSGELNARATTPDGATDLTFVDRTTDGTYAIESEPQQSVLLTKSAEDYTLVLSGGTAYKNSVSEKNVVSIIGLGYDNGIWVMNNFNFKTSAGKAVEIKDTDASIVVIGSNKIIGGTNAARTTGLSATNLTINGDGNLTIEAGTCTNGESYGLEAANNLQIGTNVDVYSGDAQATSEGIRVHGNLIVSGINTTVTAHSLTSVTSTSKAVYATKAPKAVATSAGGDPVDYDSTARTYMYGTDPATNVVLKANVVTDRLIVKAGDKKSLEDGAIYSCPSLSGQHGGAVNNSGTVNGSDVTFSGNSVTGNDMTGGAFFNAQGGTATLTRAVFDKNYATTYGGGFCNGAQTAKGGVAIFDDVVFSDNYTSSDGALANLGGTVTINTGYFSGNKSGFGGGAIYNKGTITLRDVTFEGNKAHADLPTQNTYGGAIDNDGTVILKGEVELMTETDTIYSSGDLVWDITDPTVSSGCLNGYQYITYSRNNIIQVVSGQEKGTYVLATGKIANYLDFTIKTSADTSGIAISADGNSVNYKGCSYTLTVYDGDTPDIDTDDELLLTVDEGPVEKIVRSDFNVSGLSDIAVAGGKKLYVIHDNAGKKYVKSKALANLGKWTIATPEGDYDGNGRADVLITSKASDGIRTLAGMFNIGEGTGIKFKAHNIFRYYTSQWAYRGYGDTNGDGTTDICIVLSGTTAKELGLKGRVVQVKELNSDGKVENTVKWGMLKSGVCVQALADVNGDGKSEVMLKNVKTNTIGYWKNAGAGFTAIGSYQDDCDVLAIGDFDGDNADDILFQNEDGTYSCWEKLTAKTLSEIDLGSQISGWSFNRIGDYNGDGSDEILWSNDADGRLAYSEAKSGKFKSLTVIA